ncbi:MAG: Arc family DNA-binding protein [Methylomicrobium sp.]|nr:Arc family DNA-binding protein [Methylomicrobium sp.]
MLKAKDISPTQVRIRPGLKNWLKQQAEINQRSFNSEVIYRLEESRRTQERHDHAA